MAQKYSERRCIAAAVELDNMQEVQTRISGSHVGELSKHQSLFVGA